MVFSRPLIRTRLSMALFVALLAGMLAFGAVNAPQAFAQAGSLDTTFSGDGLQTTDIGGADLGRGVDVFPDGRIVVVGTATTPPGDPGYDIAVAIYNPNGTPYLGFSDDGKATLHLQAFDLGEAVDIMIEADGTPKVIIGGCSAVTLNADADNCGAGGQMLVAKVDPESDEDAPLDTSFSGDGFAFTSGLNDAVGHDVVVQPDRKIIIAGGHTSTGGATGRDFALARFNEDGTPDSTWGVGGITTTNNPIANEDDEAWGVTLQFTDASTFKVVAAGYSDDSGPIAAQDNLNVAVARYTNAGQPDTTFSTDGWTTTDNTSGDNTFPSEDFGRDVKIQPDPPQANGTPSFPGRIVVAGSTQPSGQSKQFFVVRYTDNGAEDPAFSGDGKQVIAVPGGTDPSTASEAWGLEIQPNRKPVLVGYSKAAGADPEFAVVRLKPDGSDAVDQLDPLFSGDGKMTHSVSSGSDEAYDVALQEDGKIVSAGEAGPDFGVARYYGDPVLFVSAPAPAAEGNNGVTNFVFTVTSSAASSQDYSIAFNTSDGSAKGCPQGDTDETCDYTTVSTTVFFKAGDVVETVTVTVLGDDDSSEPNRDTFNGTISLLPGSTLPSISPSRSSAQAVILNDDAYKLSVEGPEPFNEGEPGATTTVTFRILQDPASPEGVSTTVQFATQDGTAKASDSDYVPRSGESVTFAPGESEKEVTVSVIGDDTIEPAETFSLVISNPTLDNRSGNPHIPTPSMPVDRAEATILDDDDLTVKLSIGDVSRPEGTAPEGSTEEVYTHFQFPVTLTGQNSVTVTVTYGTDDCAGEGCTPQRRASIPTDYLSNHGTLLFGPTEEASTRIQFVTVSVTAEDVPEADEIFKVRITTTSTEATMLDNEGKGTIEDDDGGEGGGPGPGACSPNASFFPYSSGFTGGVYVASGYVNDDECADIITGVGPGGGPHVQVFSGKDGSQLMSFFAFDQGFSGGVRVGSADVDNDTFDDVIVGAGPGGGPHVKVFSGATGQEIRSFFAYSSGFTGGVYVAGGYVDEDEHGDIITGVGPGGGPHVRVISGFDGSELKSFFAYDPGFSGGVRVGAADVDNDLFDDVITGAGPGGGPHVRVISGDSNEELKSFFAFTPGFKNGIFVAGGYLDSDDHGDIIAGADSGGGPHVRAFSGSDNAELASFFAYGEGFTGGVRVGSGDFDGNGLWDIVTGAGPTGGPHVRLFMR